MIKLTNDKIFILNRVLYREKYFLVDAFHPLLGLLKASARIPGDKIYRDTNALALFQEIQVDGQRRHELASIWKAEPCRSFPLIHGQYLVYAHYLNELLLNYLPKDAPALDLYHAYIEALESPSSRTFRLFEYQLILHLGLVPEVHERGAFYLLTVEHDMPILIASSQGFRSDLIIALVQDDQETIASHDESKGLFQSILHQYKPLAHRTRHIFQSLRTITS